MMPPSFGAFPLLSLPDKIVAISVVALVAVICVLQVILAQRNREIRRLQKFTGSLKRLFEDGKEQAEYSQEGKSVHDNYK